MDCPAFQRSQISFFSVGESLVRFRSIIHTTLQHNRWCCIDLLNAPRLSEFAAPFASLINESDKTAIEHPDTYKKGNNRWYPPLGTIEDSLVIKECVLMTEK